MKALHEEAISLEKGLLLPPRVILGLARGLQNRVAVDEAILCTA